MLSLLALWKTATMLLMKIEWQAWRPDMYENFYFRLTEEIYKQAKIMPKSNLANFFNLYKGK